MTTKEKMVFGLVMLTVAFIFTASILAMLNDNTTRKSNYADCTARGNEVEWCVEKFFGIKLK